jgi:hypothetical protein
VESPNPKPAAKKWLITTIVAAGLILGSVGTYFGVTSSSEEEEDLKHPVECTTDNIGCILQRLLFDLIPVLIFTTQELVDMEDKDPGKISQDPRMQGAPQGQPVKSLTD